MTEKLERRVREMIWEIMLNKTDIERDQYVNYMQDFLEVADLKITDIENQELIEKSIQERKRSNEVINIY